MKATALIAEDEALLAEGLRAELQRLWPELELLAIVGDGASAAERTLALKPDLVFLDIRMPVASGLEAAQAIAEDWPEPGPPGAAAFPLIVFVTAYDQYALQAFEAQAADYLVKPVEPLRLAASVARLKQRLAERGAATASIEPALAPLRALLGGFAAAAPAPARLEVIQAQVGAVVRLVPIDEVIYFEAADKYVRVITAEREHLIRTPLKDLLPQLDPQRFWQVHRGTVVDARRIRSARRDESGKVSLSLAGRPEILTVSRLYAHRFKGM
jgi:DNA-binding LytR/AlgR family response regulator